jgi:demethylmenaquinone methyltransferase/2-methoxy-6-polyprenyl-1,4-benzoquinol methylase
VTYQWADCDRSTVSSRYDRIAELIPFFDWLFFLPRDLRRKAVASLALSRGDDVLEIGCGTGRNFQYLRDAVGPAGQVRGIDISTGMLRKAAKICESNDWCNVELRECDAGDYMAPKPLDAVLFSLSYNTMPHHRAVLRNAWRQLRPGGRLVIMDAKVPPGWSRNVLLPFSLWLMKHTMLGNPLIHPWEELATVADEIEMSQCRFSSYYICAATKPLAAAANDNVDVDGAHCIAAE